MTRIPASIRNQNPKTHGLSVMTARRWLRYEPSSGTIYWCQKKGRKIRDDLVAGYIDDEGYRVIRLDGVNHRAHRLAWLITHGEFPPDMIDHINGDRADNRLANLRLATNSQNQMNKVGKRASASGLKGVVVVKKPSGLRYRPQIYVGGRLLTFGLFRTPAEAHAVYCREATLRFGQFARTE